MPHAALLCLIGVCVCDAFIFRVFHFKFTISFTHPLCVVVFLLNLLSALQIVSFFAYSIANFTVELSKQQKSVVSMFS